MLNRLRQIVTSLANNPALLQLLREDPQAFSQQLGLSDTEMHALNGAGELVGRLGQRLASLARSSTAAKQWLPAASDEECPVAVGNPADEGSGGGYGVPITAVVGIVGLVAGVSTVAVVALSKAEDNT